MQKHIKLFIINLFIALKTHNATQKDVALYSTMILATIFMNYP